MTDPRGIAVLYLLRNGNDPMLFEAFLASLRRCQAGIQYTPILIQKGYPHRHTHPSASQWVTQSGEGPKVFHVPDDGFDLTAYRTVASQICSPYCLFFNSYTRILAPGWLDIYAKASQQLGENAVIGATGSWTSVEKDVPYPAPHLRTTAIFLQRELYLRFSNSFATKEDCVKFESGVNGLSQSVLRSGGRIAMVGRSGQVVPPESWPESRIYYSGDQEELLVADNRSHEYQIAKPRSRLRRSMAAWGAGRADVTSRSWFARRLIDWQWRRGFGVP